MIPPRNDDWFTARDLVAQKNAKSSIPLPPCPACGGVMEPSVVDVTAPWDRGPQYVPGDLMSCAAGCFRKDPEGYLEKVRC